MSCLVYVQVFCELLRHAHRYIASIVTRYEYLTLQVHDEHRTAHHDGIPAGMEWDSPKTGSRTRRTTNDQTNERMKYCARSMPLLSLDCFLLVSCVSFRCVATESIGWDRECSADECSAPHRETKRKTQHTTMRREGKGKRRGRKRKREIGWREM